MINGSPAIFTDVFLHSPADITRISDLCESANRVLPEATASDAALANPDVAEAALRRFLAADMAFHLSIIQASGNAQIMRVVYTSSSISRIFATRRNFDLATVRSAHAQHREIADAIASRDGPGASAAILHHIRTSKHEAMEHFDMLARRGQSGMAELPPDLIRELREVEASMARDAGVTAEPGKPAE
jgi:DNA-binding GntR family transcriptional regulator